MNNSIIPTMHISASQLDSVSHQIVYVLRQFTSIPSNISDSFAGQNISMQQIRAEHGHDAGITRVRVSSALSEILQRVLIGYDVIVEVIPTFIDDMRYNLSIDVLASKGGITESYTGVIDLSDQNQIILNSAQGQ